VAVLLRVITSEVQLRPRNWPWVTILFSHVSPRTSAHHNKFLGAKPIWSGQQPAAFFREEVGDTNVKQQYFRENFLLIRDRDRDRGRVGIGMGRSKPTSQVPHAAI
jgi:hypothetical protein